MEEDLVEYVVVVEDECVFCLGENEVVVFVGSEIGGLGGEFIGYVEVDVELGVVVEVEEYLFCGGFGVEKFCIGECGFD